MKVLSLMQPWATLVVIGAKKFETRSRNWLYRGDFLIHASKEMNAEGKKLARSDQFVHTLNELKVGIDELPLGKIIGLAHISNSFPTNIADKFFLEDNAMYTARHGDWVDNVETEKSFGDYSPGRWFYELLYPVSFPAEHHYPVRGSVIKGWEFDPRICVGCGCTDKNCRACIAKTGEPCSWVKITGINDPICSACVNDEIKNYKGARIGMD